MGAKPKIWMLSISSHFSHVKYLCLVDSTKGDEDWFGYGK